MSGHWHSEFNPQHFLKRVKIESLLKRNAVESERVFEKFYLGASRLSMRRMAASSVKASEVWTFNS